MLKDMNIALFVDIDNCSLEYNHFDNTMFQLNEMGNIVYGKVYGVTDRRHKEIINDAIKFDFDIAPPMRVKKRGSKVFDNRITVDVMEEVLTNSVVDAVCIVAAAADMVPLYGKLHKLGIKIVALDNVDDESLAFVDEVLDIGLVDVIKLPRPVSGPLFTKKEGRIASVLQADSVSTKGTERKADDGNETKPAATGKDADILKQIKEAKMQQSGKSADDEYLLDYLQKLLAEYKSDND